MLAQFLRCSSKNKMNKIWLVFFFNMIEFWANTIYYLYVVSMLLLFIKQENKRIWYLRGNRYLSSTTKISKCFYPVAY